VLLAEFQGRRAQGIALLLDNSQSMRQQDRRLSAADRLRVAIATGLVPPDPPVHGAERPVDVPAATPPDPQRAEVVRAVLSNPRLKLLEGLQARGPLRPFLFGRRLRGAADDAPGRAGAGGLRDRLLAAFQADDSRTALADALTDLLQRKDA